MPGQKEMAKARGILPSAARQVDSQCELQGL